LIADRIKTISESPTIKLTTKIKQLKAEGKEIIELNIGEPDLFTPNYIKEGGINAINNNFTKYTVNSGINKLREAISLKLKNENNAEYSPEEIIVTTGAKQSVFNAIMSVVNIGDEVIIPSPYYVSYPEIVKLAGGVCVFVEGDKNNYLKPDVKNLEKVITPKTKLLVLCNPNNPTGAVLNKDELKEIADLVLKYKIHILIDEIYEKLVYDNKLFTSFVSLNSQLKDYSILVNGVSKSFCMTGWRLGFIASNKEIINAVNILQSHQTGNTSSITQYAGLSAFTQTSSFTINLKEEFEQRRNIFYELLCKIEGISLQKPEGAFYLFPNISHYFGYEFKGQKINNSIDFCNFILEHAGVAIVPGIAFGLEGFVRIAYTIKKDEIVKTVSLLSNALSKLKKIKN